jgi:hypothetical protein
MGTYVFVHRGARRERREDDRELLRVLCGLCGEKVLMQ